MFFDLAGMLILPLVGAIFFSLGFFNLLSYLQLMSKGELVDGEVVAIEYFRSRSPSTSDGHKTKNAYYSSIVQFPWSGEDHKIASIGASEMRHKLKQTVPVYVRSNSQGELIQAEIKDSANILLPSLFLLAGLIIFAIAHTQLDSSLILLGGFALVFLIIGAAVTAKINKDRTFTPHEARMDSRMIESAEDMEVEVSKNSKIAYVLGALPILGAVFILNGAYHKLNSSDRTSFKNDAWSFVSTIMEHGPTAAQKDSVMLAGVGLFFLCAGLYSLTYTRLKSKRQTPQAQ